MKKNSNQYDYDNQNQGSEERANLKIKLNSNCLKQMSASCQRNQAATALPKRLNNDYTDENQSSDITNVSPRPLKRSQKDLSIEFQTQILKNQEVIGYLPGKRMVLKELQQRETLQLKQQSGKILQFYVYAEKELGYSSELEDQLNQPYEEDDDIDTKQSLVNHFVEVCKKDLMEGIQKQLVDQEDSKRIKEKKMGSKK